MKYKQVSERIKMQGPSFALSTDDDDDFLEVKRNDFSRPAFSIPNQSRPPIVSGGGGGDYGSADMLINKRKVSGDVMSMASGSASLSSEASSDSGSEVTDSEESDAPVARGYGAPPQHQQNDFMGQRIATERVRAESEMNEKKELLYQMDRLESKGYRLPRKFTMQSDLEEMRSEFHRILREKDVDASIRFQRKMLMACVTGIEFLNNRFDPFDLQINGWSEQVHENLTDYDDIFEELHEKYKNTGRKMAPELRLLMSLSGSAFMFHLTNSMFKQSPLPSVEAVLRSNPDLFKQFQQTAAQSFTQSQAPPGGGNSGIFGMMGNMFGAMNGQQSGPPPPQMQQPQQQQQQQQRGPQAPTSNNIDSIINDIHRDIIAAPTHQNTAQNRFETLSISDEEITSIIEDTADMTGILSNSSSKKRGGGRRSTNTKERTLNL